MSIIGAETHDSPEIDRLRTGRKRAFLEGIDYYGNVGMREPLTFVHQFIGSRKREIVQPVPLVKRRVAELFSSGKVDQCIH
jgi:hypothetical protein